MTSTTSSEDEEEEDWIPLRGTALFNEAIYKRSPPKFALAPISPYLHVGKAFRPRYQLIPSIQYESIGIL